MLLISRARSQLKLFPNWVSSSILEIIIIIIGKKNMSDAANPLTVKSIKRRDDIAL